MLNLFLFLCITVQKEVATSILQKHSEKLSQLSVSMEVAHRLYTEDVISKVTLDQIEKSGGLLAGDPLHALSNKVTESPNKLRVFASVLLQSKDTVDVANDILKEYGKWFILDRKIFFVLYLQMKTSFLRNLLKINLVCPRNYVMMIVLQYIHY